jgi:hypothetical protein
MGLYTDNVDILALIALIFRRYSYNTAVEFKIITEDNET